MICIDIVLFNFLVTIVVDTLSSEIIYFCVAANGWIGTMFVNNC